MLNSNHLVVLRGDFKSGESGGVPLRDSVFSLQAVSKEMRELTVIFTTND